MVRLLRVYQFKILLEANAHRTCILGAPCWGTQEKALFKILIFTLQLLNLGFKVVVFSPEVGILRFQKVERLAKKVWWWVE